MSPKLIAAKSEQIANKLEREIRDGRLSYGDLLASEAGLMRRFSVSRNTVRRGLEILSKQGLIATRTGIGSFVTYEGSTIDSGMGWTVALSKNDGVVETRLLSIEQNSSVQADKFLNVKNGKYLCIDRLRYCSQAQFGISLEKSRLPWRDEYQPVLTNGLIADSLNSTLAKQGLFASHGRQFATVLPALSQISANIMGRTAGIPMLKLERVTKTGDGSVLEYVESILDPERFGIRVEF